MLCKSSFVQKVSYKTADCIFFEVAMQIEEEKSCHVVVEPSLGSLPERIIEEIKGKILADIWWPTVHKIMFKPSW